MLGIAQGFTYIINNANFPGGVQAVLRLLDTYGDTKVIANPHLAALDNQKATIKAGDKIPICQQTFVGSGTGTVVNNTVSTTSQYIDTGVLLQVTPHINAGGLVTLDVQVEVSIPGPLPTDCNGLAPTINTRSLQSILNVQSGQTMVMGGLITDNKQNSSAGLPLISRIPIIGGLFGQQTLTNNRTELVMFITPRVVETEVDLKGVVDDLRRRMERLEDVFPPVRPAVRGPRFPRQRAALARSRRASVDRSCDDARGGAGIVWLRLSSGQRGSKSRIRRQMTTEWHFPAVFTKKRR